MGFFSAGTFVVWGSIAYSHGWVSVTIQLTMAAAGLAVGFFIAPRWNRTGCLTAAEYITRRFGVSTQKMYTYLFLFISLFTTGAFLYPIAKIIEVTADIPLNTSILLLGAFSILYVTIGGLRAVVVTDVLQFLILFAAVITVIPLSLIKVGGAEAFLAKVPEGFFQTVSGDYTWVFIIAFMFYNLFFLGGNWAYVQRYTSVSTPRNARKVGWLFGILYLVSPILWMLPPMIYRVYNPGLEGLEAENAYLLMCKEAMPSGLLGLMLGGMIFATASSLNATLNISAGVFTNDIFKRLSPSTSEKGLMRIARWSTIGFGVLAIVVALLIPLMGGIVNVVISVAALTGVPLYLPLIWSLFSRNLNGRVILTTTVVSPCDQRAVQVRHAAHRLLARPRRRDARRRTGPGSAADRLRNLPPHMPSRRTDPDDRKGPRRRNRRRRGCRQQPLQRDGHRHRRHPRRSVHRRIGSIGRRTQDDPAGHGTAAAGDRRLGLFIQQKKS